VGQLLAHLDYQDEAINTLSERIEEMLTPCGEVLERLDTIPGVNQRTAEVLIAEIGLDMTVFPDDHHLASWAGLCPGNNESAGTHSAAGKALPPSQAVEPAQLNGIDTLG
jgi:transposase